ncbi:MAG: DUF4350 domain-containing protein [Polyangiaceae bacterium]
MDLMRARVALRERPLLDTFDLAIRFCAAHAWAYTKLSLVVLVPAFAVSYAAARLGGWWLGWSTTVIVTAFAGSPFVALASRLVFADAVGTREALGLALRAVPRLIGVRILQSMAFGASLIMLGLPWFWLGSIMLFVVEVLVLEQGTVGGTLGRAQRVANAHFADAVLTMLLLGAAPVAAAMLADVAGREILQGLLEFKPPPSMFSAGGSWLALLGWWATIPLLQTARFFVYLDIRTRTEGWDIQTRFAAIAARSEAERAEAAGLGAEKAVRRRAGATGAAVVGAMTLLTLLAVARPAHAVLDPARAQADVDAAMHDGDYPFCRAPRTPISSHARQLCPHASEIPGCAGFLKECTAVTTPPPPPPSSSPSWSWPFKGSLSVPAFFGTALQVLVWLLVAALVIAILVPIVRAILRIRRTTDPTKKDAAKKPSGPAQAEEPVSVLPMMSDEEVLLARGDELARAGQYAAALQHYLAASLRALDKRGAVRIARDRTNGEYVRGCADPNAKPALRDIVREVDRVQFGGEDATPDGATRAAQRAMAIVRAVPVMMLALVLMLATGCGGGAGGSSTVPRAGDDPAGGELFRDVLKRQGVDVGSLETSLASLVIPKPGERPPAVLVDLTRTSLDDDTRDHLVEWVDGGGVLILVGEPYAWPKAFGAASAVSTSSPYKVTVKRLLARSPGSAGDDDDDDEEALSEGTIYARGTERGVLTEGTAVGFSGTTERVATFDDGLTYAAVLRHGKGFVLGIATNELMKNAALAHPGNAAAMVAILSNADRLELRIADPEDGVSPPSTPIGALLRAGLGLGLGHALLAVLVLFVAVGYRLARPRPAMPPRRRAFAEHVEAVGSLYARTRNAPHALTAYARFADERLRARMPRGTGDVAAFLASRGSMPLDVCQRLWARALQAKAGAPPLGDELAVLRELTAVYAAAMAQGDGYGQR